MSEEMNKEETKAAKQEEITELSDDRLDEAAGGELCTVDAVPAATLHPVDRTDEDLRLMTLIAQATAKFIYAIPTHPAKTE